MFRPVVRLSSGWFLRNKNACVVKYFRISNNVLEDYLFWLLYRACCQVTQLLYQQLHLYKMYKIYKLKH
jgi:hypothetical protein